VDASLATANRSAHFKIVLVAVLAAAAVVWIASCAQVNTIAGADQWGLAMKVHASAFHAQCDDVSVL
jgi:predicted alternative tryptophan synthase beta-subunit